MTITDGHLVIQTRAGELEAFDELMIRYQRLVFQVALGFCNQSDRAMDLTQDIFLKAFQRLNTLKQPKFFRAWLMKIAYHEGVTFYRRYGQEEVCDLTEWEPLLMTDDLDQESWLVAMQRKETLQSLLAKLNPKHRLAIVLRYLNGAPVRDIANILECSEAVVKNMLYRSVQRLALGAKKWEGNHVRL